MRFAQALGFEGFPEGRPPRATSTAARARTEPRRPSSPPLFPIDQTEFETALAADHSNVAETAKRIDRDEVAAAVDLISRADRILLCGTDQMAFFASYLRHLLMLLDLRVRWSPRRVARLAKLGRVDDKTVMIGFLGGRRTCSSRAMKLARNRRAATIDRRCHALEVVKLADHRSTTRRTGPRTCASTRRCSE